jgi:transposase InsO family protein
LQGIWQIAEIFSNLNKFWNRVDRDTQHLRSPWENGYNESSNGKLRDEVLNGKIFYTLKEAQILIERWRREYNTVRPHSRLGNIEGRSNEADLLEVAEREPGILRG